MDQIRYWYGKALIRGKSEEVIKLPDTISTESYISTGALQVEKDDLSVFVVVSDLEDGTSDSGGSRLLRVTEKGRRTEGLRSI